MSEPTKYRKRPVTIEAMHWNGSAEGATPIIDWALSHEGTIRYHEATEYIAPSDTDSGQPALSARLAIDTLEGTLWAFPDYYVIRGVQGEFYGCQSAIFDKTYEPAE